MSVQTDPLSGGIGTFIGSRYDWLLVAIPVPLLLGWLVGTTTAISLPSAVGAGAVPAGLLVLYGLFVVTPPVPSNSQTASDSGGSGHDVGTFSEQDGGVVASFGDTDDDPATGSVSGCADD